MIMKKAKLFQRIGVEEYIKKMHDEFDRNYFIKLYRDKETKY